MMDGKERRQLDQWILRDAPEYVDSSSYRTYDRSKHRVMDLRTHLSSVGLPNQATFGLIQRKDFVEFSVDAWKDHCLIFDSITGMNTYLSLFDPDENNEWVMIDNPEPRKVVDYIKLRDKNCLPALMTIYGDYFYTEGREPTPKEVYNFWRSWQRDLQNIPF